MKLILLTLFILALLIPTLGQAQSDGVSIAPCLPENAALIRLEGTTEWTGKWVQAVKDIPAFYALEGEYIEWLGYAPKGQEYKEPFGVEYGFAGVDMRNYGEQFYIYLYGAGKTLAQREVVGRIEVHEYGDQYIFFHTNTYANADRNGEHMGYHIFADPRRNGQACMFWITKSDFNYAIAYKK